MPRLPSHTSETIAAEHYRERYSRFYRLVLEYNSSNPSHPLPIDGIESPESFNSRTRSRAYLEAISRMEDERHNEARRRQHSASRRSNSPTRHRTRLHQEDSSMAYHGWAPGSSDDITLPPIRDLERLSRLDEPRHPNDTATRRHYREQEQRALDLARSDAEGPAAQSIERLRERYNNYYASERARNPTSPDPDLSLRSAALLGSARRHVRLSHLVGDGSPRSEQDREHAQHFAEYTPPPQRRDQRRSLSSLSRRLEGVSDMQRSPRGSNPGPSAGDALSGNSSHASPARWFADAIAYLGQVRACHTPEEQISCMQDAGLLIDDGQEAVGNIWTQAFISTYDFVFDPTLVPPPPPSSWLRPGCVFHGFQHANASPTPPPHRQSAAERRVMASLRAAAATAGTPVPRGGWVNNVLSSARGNGSPGPAGSGVGPSGPSPSGTSPGSGGTEERWPVRVTINSIDYASMTLTGTMEASEVPNKAGPASAAAAASITTHLEGELVDFARHALETTSFNADSGVDSTYWRKLEPFRSLGDAEVVASVVSRAWLSQKLNQNYILMRWKEKCFVTPSDAQLEVTISGFYYTSLRRDTGQIEGLYYDPQSSPYQRLKLKPERPTFPAYKFT